MKFKDYFKVSLEEGIGQIRVVGRMTDIILNFVDKTNKKYRNKNVIASFKTIFKGYEQDEIIGDMVNLTRDVRVLISPDAPDGIVGKKGRVLGAYSSEDNVIKIYNKHTVSKQSIQNTISHELTHMYDDIISGKKTNLTYNKDMTNYDNVEFEVRARIVAMINSLDLSLSQKKDFPEIIKWILDEEKVPINLRNKYSTLIYKIMEYALENGIDDVKMTNYTTTHNITSKKSIPEFFRKRGLKLEKDNNKNSDYIIFKDLKEHIAWNQSRTSVSVPFVEALSKFIEKVNNDDNDTIGIGFRTEDESLAKLISTMAKWPILKKDNMFLIPRKSYDGSINEV